MGSHYLTPLFKPRSVAVFGASPQSNAVGGRVFRNLVEAPFPGTLIPVNPRHKTVAGHRCLPNLKTAPAPVELAVIATPADTIPTIIEDCGHHGVAAAVILSAGFRESGPAGKSRETDVLKAAAHYGIRLIGPNSLGIMRPTQGLNATFFKGQATAGKLALVSQSGALCSAILDWAQPHDIGFSTLVSLGESADIDFAEMLDYLTVDPETESILLYIEGIRQARPFMSALRAAARIKPVIALKVGRSEAGSRAVISHTGALVGSDEAFEAAFERAGVVRVESIAQLFAAAATLSTERRCRGESLTIITNGGGPGALAADAAVRLGVPVATLSAPTLKRLNECLPPLWSHENPVDVLGDASPERYQAAFDACVKDPNTAGIIVILTPQAMTRPREVAEALIASARKSNKPIIACWMGETQVAAARRQLMQAKIPCFDDTLAAVEAFSHLVTYRNNQKMLLQIPGPLSDASPGDINGAQLIMEKARGQGQRLLSTAESKALLSAFRIPVTAALPARSAHEALIAAEELGFPVAIKIDSPDVTHKSDVGGVALHINDAYAVRAAFQEISEHARKARPEAKITGVTVEKMIVSPQGREVMIGVITDDTFGPVISFGLGGTLVEVFKDHKIALPPLNELIIENMIRKSRAAALLNTFRNLKPANRAALVRILYRVSEMVCELPWIREMDLNPVICDDAGAVVVDARIAIDPSVEISRPYDHLAIHPYPTHLIHKWQLADGTGILIRPIRPEDANIEKSFVDHLSEQSKYQRFMGALPELPQDMLVRFTQIDYDREMALVAVTQQNGQDVEIGVGRYMTTPDGSNCEFALVVADAWQNRGIGRRIMEDLISIARAKGLATMTGMMLRSSTGMIDIVKELGFEISTSREEATLVEAVKNLQA